MSPARSPACRAQAAEPSAHSRPPTGHRATQCPRLAIAPQKSARGGRREMIAACAASWKGAQTKPTTACGTYGSSREVISPRKVSGHGCESSVEMGQLGSADDRRGYDRLGEHTRH